MAVRHLLVLLAITFISLGVTPAAACSPVAGHRLPTNLELVERADVIVLGTVEREEDIGGTIWKAVIVRPTLLLKGAALPAEVRLQASLADGRWQATRSDPREFARANPDVFRGACTRDVFERGMQLVLFLERDRKGELQPSLPTFGRGAEDVPSPDAPWVKAVRLYAEIAALPAKRRRAALLARRDALRGSGDPDAALIAADIDRQLGEGDR